MLLAASLAGVVLAVNNITLESSYLGDGLFKYEMTVHKDPFLSAEQCDLHIASFTNLIEVVEHTPDWVFTDLTNSFSLRYPGRDIYIPRPYSAYCIVRSSCTNFCVGNFEYGNPLNGAIVSGSIGLVEDFLNPPPPGIVSGNIVFYTKMEAAIPCLKENADGSPAVCTRLFEMVPDIKIGKIVTQNGRPVGLEFLWERSSTVLIQASADLQNWVDVQYALGSPPLTQWFSQKPLDTYGSFYRILLVSDNHHPELLGDTVAQMKVLSSVETPSKPTFYSSGVNQGKGSIQIDTVEGVRYIISIKNKSNEIFRTMECIATGEQTIVDVDLIGVSEAAFIDVDIAAD